MLMAVALGGLTGTIARYALTGWLQPAASAFPRGTIVVNVLGAILLGFLMRYTTGAAVVSPEIRAGLTIGFCGAFTTMSTFGYESVRLVGDGEYGAAALYMGITLVGSLAGILAGAAFADRLL